MELSAGLTAGDEPRAGAPPGSPFRRPAALTATIAALALTLLLCGAGAVRAERLVALYNADWAGLPAGQIRLELDDAAASYRDRIEIRTNGLPRLFTHFRGTAQAIGRLDRARPAAPSRYEARYDLRRRRGSRIAMRFVERDGIAVAERSPGDSSRKPPLAERFRRGIVDPLSALESIRAAIAARGAAPGSRFAVPVYDGARRFDILARILPQAEQPAGLLQVALNLRPIAGFKGESSDDGDPEDAPRPATLTLTHDARLLPVTLSVKVFYLPLLVQLTRVCAGSADCS